MLGTVSETISGTVSATLSGRVSKTVPGTVSKIVQEQYIKKSEKNLPLMIWTVVETVSGTVSGVTKLQILSRVYYLYLWKILGVSLFHYYSLPP